MCVFSLPQSWTVEKKDILQRPWRWRPWPLLSMDLFRLSRLALFILVNKKKNLLGTLEHTIFWVAFLGEIGNLRFLRIWDDPKTEKAGNVAR